jgi:hypothetical protein
VLAVVTVLELNVLPPNPVASLQETATCVDPGLDPAKKASLVNQDLPAGLLVTSGSKELREMGQQGRSTTVGQGSGEQGVHAESTDCIRLHQSTPASREQGKPTPGPRVVHQPVPHQCHHDNTCHR